MPVLSNVVLASGNPGKLREFSALFQPLGVDLIAQSALGIPEAPEPHPTFVENALAKARHASALSGLPALADDSGICVAALGGEPGIHSARYAEAEAGEKSDEANNRKLIAALAGVQDRRACYVAALVLVTRPDDPLPVIAQATWDGLIVDAPQGEHGFGYDPHFFLPAEGLCAAQLDPVRKNAISHRATALQALLVQLRSRGLIA